MPHQKNNTESSGGTLFLWDTNCLYGDSHKTGKQQWNVKILLFFMKWSLDEVKAVERYL